MKMAQGEALLLDWEKGEMCMMQRECIIYGSGEWGRQAYWEYGEKYRILCYVDKNPGKWGNLVYDVPIKAPEEMSRHQDATVVIAVDNDAGIEEYVRAFGISKVIHYRYDAMSARKPALVYGTGEASMEAAKLSGDRYRVAGLVREQPDDAHRSGLRSFPADFLATCPEAVLILPEMLADSKSLSRIKSIFAGDMLKYSSGNGVCPLLPMMERKEPRIFIDVTISRKKKHGEGVARAADRLWEELKKIDSTVMPVRDLQGTMVTDFAYEGKNRRDYRVGFMPGDRLLLMDPSWPDYRDFDVIIDRAQSAGAKVYALVYDLIPSYMPELFSDSIRRPFFYWHDLILQKADGLICISHHTVKKAKEYAVQRGLKRQEPPSFYTSYLGADLKITAAHGVREELRDFLKAPLVFLTVGTIEPRKSHQTIIRAFARLREQAEAKLLILGHDGWLNADIKKAIEAHQEKGILWINDATDAELKYAYEHATALIAASLEEGFGLPLVEAANLGLPVICSNIEVFREVMGTRACYFSPGDDADLSRKMETCPGTTKQKSSPLGARKRGSPAGSRGGDRAAEDEVERPASIISWRQAGLRLRHIITPIPKKIHFCWLSGEAYPPLVQQCLNSWQKYLPDYELKIWTKDNSPLHDNEYIKEALSVGKYAFASDYIRLCALYREGGIYLDSDVEVLKNFDPLLMEPAFIGWERCGRVGPWLIASKAGNPLIKTLLEEYEGRHFLNEKGEMNLTVNTVPTTKLLVEKGLQPEDEIQRLEDFTVFPERYFCPKDPWTLEMEITEDTYAIHHFAGSWNHLADGDMPFIKAVPEMVEAFLERYREKYQGRPIVIYGTGIVAFNAYKAMQKHPESRQLAAFMVTRLDNAWRNYGGTPIVEIRDVEEWDVEPVVLIGTLERYHEEIRGNLKQFGYQVIATLG